MNDTQTPAPAAQPAHDDINPFYIATNGLELLFKRAQTIGIVLAVLSLMSALGSLPGAFGGNGQQQPTNEQGASAFPNIPLEVWLLIGGAAIVIFAIVIAIGVIIRGISDYTAAHLARNEAVTLSEAFRAVFENFWSYLWLLVVVGFKVFLWTLLLIVPGIVMSVRYSLAGTAFFEKGLRGNMAVQHSSRLVKGAWVTTFASRTLFNLITFGVLQTLLQPGTNALLYRQLSVAGDAKPKTHILSWVTFWLTLGLALLIIFVVIPLMIFVLVMAMSQLKQGA